jgi:hypothetical protein
VNAFARFPQETAWERSLKRITIGVFSSYLVIATISGFRAIVQIYSVRITAPTILRPGASVSTIVRSSGRTFGDVTLELAQNGRVDTLAKGELAANRNSVFDPRPQTGTLAVSPDPRMLAHFENGPAEIRSIARGRSQFLRVPPPKIATVRTRISK